MTFTLDAPTASTRNVDQELSPDRGEMLSEVLVGLSSEPKTLPCKYFYDERGSALFDAICDVDEYYPTRTELAIMREHVSEMASAIQPGDVLVELGSGSSVKTRLLLDVAEHIGAYVPVDISAEHLSATAERLRFSYPGLDVVPIAADYTQPFQLPVGVNTGSRVIAYFPGSTIGNFAPHEARAFLERIRLLCGSGGRLLIGIDLRKDESVLNAAYNDARGITAEFNLNLLARLNRELGSDFDLTQFEHRAYFNPEQSRIEMHLVSLRDQSVRVGGATIMLAAGETIWTESSYKHTLDGFSTLAAEAGYKTEKVWTDARQWFAVLMLLAD